MGGQCGINYFQCKDVKVVFVQGGFFTGPP